MNYWRDFWKSKGDLEDSNFQVAVARTRDKKPISPEVWKQTISILSDLIPNHNYSSALDLCGGNGLFVPLLLSKSSKVTVVDINTQLLSQNLMMEKKYDLRNKEVLYVNSDAINHLKNSNNVYDFIFFYAGIQYFSESEVVVLFELMYDKLSVDGLIFIGDIPDIQYRSNYLIQSGKQEIYFDSVKRNEPLIGTWFDKGTLELLANRVGFRKIRVITQDPIMIFSDFRFDLMLNK
jgi:predicted O-methyltransferase YrrM